MLESGSRESIIADGDIRLLDLRMAAQHSLELRSCERKEFIGTVPVYLLS